MITALLMVGFGMLLLVGGGEALLRGAVGLAQLAKLTPAVIGLTVVAAGTSVPELAVSLVAAWEGQQAVAVGNVVGSNIFNIAAILGLTALLRPFIVGRDTIKIEFPFLAFVTALCIALCYDGEVSRSDGLLFIALYCGFTAYLVTLVRRRVSGESTAGPESAPPPYLCAIYLTIGIALLAYGASITVDGAVRLGRLLGMSEHIIGLTIVAIGTSLPEVVTSLVSAFRGRADVAIGNVIGSNLFNILMVLGLSSAISPLHVPSEIIRSDVWWMLGITLVLLPIIVTGRKISRPEGAFLLCVYLVYLGMLVAS